MEIHQTLKFGVNATHDDSRASQMLGFGKDEILSRTDVFALVSFVRHLAGKEQLSPADLASARTLYTDNCVDCHGEEGGGSTEFGAPNLTDATWLYGGDPEAIYTSIFFGRQGHMPHWNERLTPEQIKILAVYVHRLGGA
jgi:cytochrome c oxidase cbb3-type subunit 3